MNDFQKEIYENAMKELSNIKCDKQRVFITPSGKHMKIDFNYDPAKVYTIMDKMKFGESLIKDKEIKMNKEGNVFLAKRIADTDMLEIIGSLPDSMGYFDGDNSWDDTNHALKIENDKIVVSFDIPVMGGMDHLEFKFDSWQELLEKFIKKKSSRLTLVFDYE